MKCWPLTLAILAVLSVSPGLAEDFKTINGKVYKDATISRVEANGIVLRTKTGISKVYFVELPKDVRERFLPSPAKTGTPQREREREPTRLTSWEEAIGNLTSSTTFFVAGAFIIAAVVFAIVRSRIQ